MCTSCCALWTLDSSSRLTGSLLVYINSIEFHVTRGDIFVVLLDFIYKQRPLLIPKPFSGEASSNWDEWLVHFENCAAVNSWESD